MAEEYVLVKKTTHDQMKLRQNDRKEVRDQATNTEDPSPSEHRTGSGPMDGRTEDLTHTPAEHQTGSGLIYGKAVKRKAPPGYPSQKKKKTWFKF
jgi:hypothetical protein